MLLTLVWKTTKLEISINWETPQIPFSWAKQLTRELLDFTDFVTHLEDTGQTYLQIVIPKTIAEDLGFEDYLLSFIPQTQNLF